MVEKETVIVDNGDRRTHNGWVIALVVLILIVLFFMFGGANMFSGQAGTGAGTGTEINTPTTAPTVTPAPTGTGQ